jgi:glycosyltransferase involved in cell wall biosynthesis
MGGLDLVIVVYIFPWIVSVNSIKNEIGYKTIAFLRGSDVFSGCAKESNYRKYLKDDFQWHKIADMMISSINKSDLVLSVSEMLKQFANKRGIRVDGVYPTPPFPESKAIRECSLSRRLMREMFLKTPPIESQFGNIKIDNRWIAYLGRFHSEKQTCLVITAFNMCKHKDKYSLIFAGTGAEKQYLQNLSKKLNLKDLHIGFIPPKIVPLFCKVIDVLIHPTTPNSFLDARPSSCMNAAYMGIPVIFPFKEGIECTGLNESVSKLNVQLLTVNPALGSKKIAREISKKIDMILSEHEIYHNVSLSNLEFTEQFETDRIFFKIEEEIKRCLKQ